MNFRKNMRIGNRKMSTNFCGVEAIELCAKQNSKSLTFSLKFAKEKTCLEP